jgi:hypothetical protein
VSEDPSKRPDRKVPLHSVPAILTGAAALIASLTAVYVNLRGDRSPPPAPQAQVAAPATPARTAEAKPVAPKPIDKFMLRVDRIAVEHDGSPGTTDWRFVVEADDAPLFAFSQRGLDDTGGLNVARPKDADGVLRLEGRPGARIVVKGWRGRMIFGGGGAPDVSGEGRLSANGAIGPIRVDAPHANPKALAEAGAFVFFLSADPAE